MLDAQLFRDSPELVRANLRRRGLDTGRVDEVVQADAAWRESLDRQNRMRAERNKIAHAIADAKKAKQDAAPHLERMKRFQTDLEAAEAATRDLYEKRRELLMRFPNLLHESVPEGKDDAGNVTVRTWGAAKPHAFAAKSHVDLLESMKLADIERAGKVAGARFFYLTGDGVRLSFALQQFALDRLRQKGFTLVDPPYMLRRAAIAGATDLHDFEDVIYKIEGEDLHLIATSEHAVGAFHWDEILEDKQLPLRYAGVSPCFRKEAGAHGKDTKGIFRVHQFQKIEMFAFSRPDESWPLHDELLAHAEELLQALELPYRVVNICTGDIGTVAAKKYDLEAWMPVQGTYRELVSCSNCTDYQARRWNIRTRKSTDQPTVFVHTLNSTALAIQRTIVALLENHQLPDGTIHIPAALRPYLGGQATLGAS